MADRIQTASGNLRMAAPADWVRPLVVRVLSARPIDLLGSRGPRRPVPGARVTFAVELSDTRRADAPWAASGKGGDPTGEPAASALPPHPLLFPIQDGAPDPASPGQSRLEVVADAQGLASVAVRLGTGNGAWTIESSLDKKGERVRFSAICGVEIEDAAHETPVESKVPIRLRLLKYGMEGGGKPGVEPLPGRRITFQVSAEPPGAEESASLKDKRNETDLDGYRETEITVGEKPGLYQVLATIEPKPGDVVLPAIVLSFTATDWASVAWKSLTGVLVFVFGVRLLGSGFLLILSSYAHLPTQSWGRRRLHGYSGGVAAGLIFESASLVNSHLINLANGGLLTATSAFAILLGANVGGSVLPQLLCLEPGFLAAPFLVLGLLVMLIPRRLGLSAWSGVLLGAGLALTGWTLLVGAADQAALSQQLRASLGLGEWTSSHSLWGRLSGLSASFLLGFGAAFFLRTSNLVVVMALLLVSRNILSAPAALPLVVGANLGSAAMMFVLSLRKRQEARRLALSNLLLFTLGTAVALLLYLPQVGGEPLLLRIFDNLNPAGYYESGQLSAGGRIAAAHTLYNLLAGAVFLLFPRLLFSIVDRVWVSHPPTEEIKPFILDRNLLNVPALALRQATEEVHYLTEVSRKAVAESFDSFRYNDLDLSEQVVRRGEVISELHRNVSRYLVEVCESALSRRDASQLEVLQTAAASLVRIGELAERLRDLAARKLEDAIAPSAEVDKDLAEVYDLTMAQFTNILGLLRQRDTRTEENAVKMVERLAKISARLESQLRQRIEQAEGATSQVALHLQNMIYQEAFNLLFRVASQLGHVALTMRILAHDRF